MLPQNKKQLQKKKGRGEENEGSSNRNSSVGLRVGVDNAGEDGEFF